MSDNENSLEFLSIMNEISTNGMDRKLYESVASKFSGFHNIPPAYLLRLLRYFVNFGDGDPLYTNEIKNYLRENDQELFLEYGNRFRNCRGCFEVFGIQPESTKEYDFRVDQRPASDGKAPEGKSYNGRKERGYGHRKIKRQARLQAAEKHKERIEHDNEKRKKREEIDRLIRKQDL